MTQTRPDARSFIPVRPSATFGLAAVAAVAGGLVGAVYAGIVGPALRSPPLTLEPYLDPGWRGAAFGWAASAAESPWTAAILVALGAAALVLSCDAVLRRAFLASKPNAAAFAVVALLLSASFGPMLRIEGHGGIVAGWFVAPVACLFALEGGRRGAWAGAVLSAVAAGLHPAWAGAAVVVAACALGGRRFVAAAAAVAGAAALALWSAGAGDAAPALGWPDRIAFAARDLAAAPLLAFSPDRRLDLPTGYESLVSDAPVMAGLLAHALILGAGMMIGGIGRGLVCAAAAAVSAFAGAIAVPGWVPGNRAFAFPVMAALAPLAALVAAAMNTRLAPAPRRGIVVGAAAVAVLLAWDRAPRWTRIGPAMALAGGHDFGREPDPARLVLYLHDVTLRDPEARSVAEAADRAIAAGAPALFPDRLDRILAGLTVRSTPRRETPVFSSLARRVSAELDAADLLWRQGTRSNFEAVAEMLRALQIDVLELWFNWRHEPETHPLVQRFARLVREVAPVAGRTGHFEYSIPLLEALQLIGPDFPGTDATIAIHTLLSGDLAAANERLARSLEALPKGLLHSLVRGLHGLTLFHLGDPEAGLRDMQLAWSVIGAGGIKNVSFLFPNDSMDFIMVAEILMARYEAALAVDPALATQAARDLEMLLDPLLAFGPRRVPALAMLGRLALLRGDRARALELLREARALPHDSLDDRSDGPAGRMAQPRYRKLALESLLEALEDVPGAEAERDDVRAELARLAGPG